jgi:hypothetical protein
MSFLKKLNNLNVERHPLSFNSRFIRMGKSIPISNASALSMNGAGTRFLIVSGGTLRVYSWNSASQIWTQLGSNVSVASNGRFAMNNAGDRFVYGEPTGGTNGSGAVSVYSYVSNAWTQLGNSVFAERNDVGYPDLFGNSVDINDTGDRIVVGAPYNDAGNAGNLLHNYGHVRVFYLSGSTWTQLGADIDIGTDPTFKGSQFGASVAINGAGNKVIIGAPLSDGPGDVRPETGETHIYNYTSSWARQGSIIYHNTDHYPTSNLDRSGSFVSMNTAGDRIAILSPNAVRQAGNGEIRVFSWNGSAWTQLGNFLYGDNGEYLREGRLNSAGDKLVATSNAFTRIYSYNSTSGTWVLETAINLGRRDFAINAAADRIVLSDSSKTEVFANYLSQAFPFQ